MTAVRSKIKDENGGAIFIGKSDTSMDQIRDAFDAIASEYDAERRGIIPDYDDFYHAAVTAADWPGEEPRILDIGAGTGALSALLLGRYPEADLTLLDISTEMLAIAAKRFHPNEHVHLIVSDYSHEGLPGSFDLVCSALSIHHLENAFKQQLFTSIFAALNPGGFFINAEQVMGETPDQHRRNMAYWDDFVRTGPLPPRVWTRAMQRRDTLDRMEKLTVQLVWLREAGFTHVDVLYKNRMFAVMRGQKED
jgi:tRNA (cmo5U34)-methyltransferase